MTQKNEKLWGTLHFYLKQMEMIGNAIATYNNSLKFENCNDSEICFFNLRTESSKVMMDFAGERFHGPCSLEFDKEWLFMDEKTLMEKIKIRLPHEQGT